MALDKPHSTSSQIASVISIPGYKIEDLLGRGGMAVVYLAIQESIGRKVALKVMTPDHSIDDFTERFLREAQIVSRLAHPNIVTIYDAGVHQGCHYMSMEYIPGLNLRQARDTLSRKEKIKIIKQVAQALDFAGKKGFVHRDIKPENIMQHEDGRAILTDFGIARGMASNKSLTLTGKAIGTPYYMSPEQAKGLKDVDPRSDIYSLGVVLFQYLAGYLPYNGASIVAIGIKHISDPVPFLPKGLAIFQPIIDMCMAKDPEERYQTAGELFVALDSISDEEIDDIDKKTAALQQAGQDHDSSTIMIDDVEIVKSTPASSKVKKPAAVQAKPNSQKLKKTAAPNTSPGTSKTAIPPIDITNTSDFKKLKNRSRVILLFLLLIVVSIAYYKQKDILNFWQVRLEPLVQQLLKNNPVVTTTTSIAPVQISNIDNQYIAIDQNQIMLLRNTLSDNPENAKKIVQLYIDVLDSNPDNQDALQGLKDLEEWFYNAIKETLNNQNSSRAKILLQHLTDNFPSVLDTEKFQRIKSGQIRIETLQSHLKMAQVFINTQSLIKPEEANAVNELHAALKIDPENKKALELTQEITNIFISKARQQADGKAISAMQHIKSGLAVSPNNAKLLAMQKTLSKQIQKQKEIGDLLARAKKQLNSGNLIKPENNNAYDLYQTVLTKQKNNSYAKNGIKNIKLEFAGKMRAAIKHNNFKQANAILKEAQIYFKDSSIITQTKQELEFAIEQTLPKVIRILFSDSAINSLSNIQKENIHPGRVLHIGFNYKNFSTESTLIQANLLDGSGRIQIAQKPVIVTGKDGEHIFYIELPVEGFSDGTYNLELLLKNKPLIKASFQVKNKITE